MSTMSTVVTVPQGLPYVGASLLSSIFLVTGQVQLVKVHRKASGIQYPQLYAEREQVGKSVEALRFNCAQRAHQNTLEYIPFLYLTTCITAMKYPILAASLCGAWVFARVFYTLGYVSGKPEKRSWGADSSHAALFCLIGASIYTVGTAVMGA